MEEREFISCVKLFPEWKGAESQLKSFCDGIGDWDVRILEKSLFVSRQYPFIRPEKSEDDAEVPKPVSMVRSFPEVYQQKVSDICAEVAKEYCPDLSDYMNKDPFDGMIEEIMEKLVDKEKAIIAAGGRKVVDEIRFRLGIKDD